MPDPIELTEVLSPETRALDGFGAFDLAAGKHLKIKTSPRGTDLLDAVVPEGKVWTVRVNVSIREEDA